MEKVSGFVSGRIPGKSQPAPVDGKMICGSKSCQHKGQPQPIENFKRKPGVGTVGREGTCKDCVNAYAKTVREKKKQWNEQYGQLYF